MQKKKSAALEMHDALRLALVEGLQKLESNGHHEHVLLGVVNVAEIECLTQDCVVQAIKHFAQAKIVVDIECESPNVNAQTGLKTPSDGFRVEILLISVVFYFNLLSVNGIGFVKQCL